jgi:protein TonB
VSDVTAISGPETGGLREEAVRVIKKSGKWTAAIQNGRQVKSYKKQPIVFKLDTQ